MATSFQRLHTWRKLNVPSAKCAALRWRLDSTTHRNTSDRTSAGRPEIGMCEFWADLGPLISLKRNSIRFGRVSIASLSGPSRLQLTRELEGVGDA